MSAKMFEEINEIPIKASYAFANHNNLFSCLISIYRAKVLK